MQGGNAADAIQADGTAPENQPGFDAVRAAVGVALLLVSSGCGSLRARAPIQALVEASEPEAVQPPEVEPRSAPDSPPAEFPELDDPAWVVATASDDRDAHRWQHPALEQHLGALDHPESTLSSALRAENEVVATNAAISLARRGGARGVSQLVAAVSKPALPLPLRSAAAEALGDLPTEQAQSAMLDLLARVADFEAQPRSVYSSQLHRELLHALSRAAPNAATAELARGLESPAGEVRLAALELWGERPASALPASVEELIEDPDPRVRAAALSVLARHPGKQLDHMVARGLADHDRGVRLAAIEALGRIGGPDSIERLREIVSHEAEAFRAAAITSLTSLGAFPDVLAARDDPSWRVRQAAAWALAVIPPAHATETARRLLHDTSSKVRQEVVSALESWPITDAGPLLLEGLAQRTYISRQMAVEQLARRWPPAAEFPMDASVPLRTAAARELRERWDREMGMPATVGRGAVATEQTGPRESASSETELVDIARWIAALRDADVARRRQAAEELRGAASQWVASRVVQQQLMPIILAESDALVWRSLLMALGEAATSEAQEIAAAATSHPAAEVRRRGCEHLEAHPHPRFAPTLVACLRDQDAAVVRAATRALAPCGPLEDAAPLIWLLKADDRELRIEAALTLCRWNDGRGRAALERLAVDGEPHLRAAAIRALGTVPSPESIPTLIAALDAHPVVRRAALESLAVTAQPDDLGPAGIADASTDEKLAAVWKAWAAETLR